MKRIKIKIDDIFKKLGIDKTTENEDSWKNIYGLKIKDHHHNFIPILEFVKKKTDAYKTIFENGVKLISSNEHILLTNNGEKKIKDITDDDSIIIRDEGSIDQLTKIVSHELFEKDAQLYDFCLNKPHLFKDTDGLVHHNSPIRIPQSIGRALRRHHSKKMSYIHDIVDQYKYPLRHYTQRRLMYKKEFWPIKYLVIDVEKYK